MYRRYEAKQNNVPVKKTANKNNSGSFNNTPKQPRNPVEANTVRPPVDPQPRQEHPQSPLSQGGREADTHGRQNAAPTYSIPYVEPEEPPKTKKSGNPLLSFIPETIYNPETKKIFGVLSADDLLILALIILFLDSDEDGDTLMVLALAFILISEWFDFDLSKFGL